MKTIITKGEVAFILPLFLVINLIGCDNPYDSGHIEEKSDTIIVERMETPVSFEDTTDAKETYSSPSDDPELNAEINELDESTKEVSLDPDWEYAELSVINDGNSVLYHANDNPNGIIVAVNAGHGTKGGQLSKTYCHPDKSPKVTGGTTEEGAIKAVAVSGGMTFADGTKESIVTLRLSEFLRDALLESGYDVLMVRDAEDVQLDNVARTVIANNTADCLISVHWDGDNLNYDKGCFYISTPNGIKDMEPVASHWEEHEKLGASLIEGLKTVGCNIYGDGKMNIDLTQTSYSTIPSVDIELGNAISSHGDETLKKQANGLLFGIDLFFEQ